MNSTVQVIRLRSAQPENTYMQINARRVFHVREENWAHLEGIEQTSIQQTKSILAVLNGGLRSKGGILEQISAPMQGWLFDAQIADGLCYNNLTAQVSRKTNAETIISQIKLIG
jgi:hypothetical protein